MPTPTHHHADWAESVLEVCTHTQKGDNKQRCQVLCSKTPGWMDEHDTGRRHKQRQSKSSTHRAVEGQPAININDARVYDVQQQQQQQPPTTTPAACWLLASKERESMLGCYGELQSKPIQSRVVCATTKGKMHYMQATGHCHTPVTNKPKPPKIVWPPPLAHTHTHIHCVLSLHAGIL